MTDESRSMRGGDSTPRWAVALPDWAPASTRPAGSRRLVGVLPGEGIGPEVVAAAVEVLETAVAGDGGLEFRYGGPIGTEAVEAHGSPLTQEVSGWCEQIFADGGAVFCGPGGSRFVYELRARFDLFCKVTPVRPLSALANAGVLTPEAREGVDIAILRENAGGIYFGRCGREFEPALGAVASHSFRYSEHEVRRIIEVGVRLARRRSGRIALVVKPDGIPAISGLWTEIFQELTDAELSTRVLEVDNAAYQLIAAAQEFDIVVAPNLFGDILSDGAALLLASRGLSFSGNFGPRGVAVYQTGHGAAHDLAGRGVANPIAQILAGAMMLRESFCMAETAASIEAAIETALGKGLRTRDIAEPGTQIVSTREMSDAIATLLRESLRGSQAPA